MQLSVIILNYNVQYFLELCLQSVQKAIANIDAEIIVVDNDSTDDSCKIVHLKFPNVKLLVNKENYGFPKGNNIGVSHAKGQYICILNPDTVVAEDTFEKILNNIKGKTDHNSENLGIIGCKLIDGSGKFLPESKRGTPTPFVAFSKITGLYKLNNYFGKYYAQHLNENQSGNVDILVGAFMLMERKLYMDIGGFDENCFMYSDDVDLSYMVLQKGFSNYYFHETSIIHFKGESTIKDDTYMVRFQQAMRFFYTKHFRVSTIFWLFMKMGIIYFSFLKKFQGQTKTSIKPSKFILISNNENLQNRLEDKLLSEITVVDNIHKINETTATEIIFDSSFISFKNIIACMNQLQNRVFTFKIIPKNAHFMLGSNSSDTRGEIIVFDD